MSLVDEAHPLICGDASEGNEGLGTESKQKTIREAIERLQSCRDVINQTVKQYENDTGEKRSSLNVDFDKLSTFQTNLSKCQVSPRSS